MLKTLVAVVFSIGLVAIGSPAQSPQKPELRHPADFPRVNTSKSDSAPDGSEAIVIEIAANKGVRIAAIKGYESWGPGAETIKKALAQTIATQKPKPFELAVHPRVIFRIEPAVDMRTVFDLLKIARNGASELSVEITDLPSLRIPPEPDDRFEMDLKPNPLFLIAAFDEKGAVALNNEASGSVKDLSVIASKLKNVFRERERNAIFRENTNEIEKSVFVRVPESARFADLSSFAKTISGSGGDRLWLAMEKVGYIEDPVEMIDLSDADSPIDTPPVKPKAKPRPKTKTRSKPGSNE